MKKFAIVIAVVAGSISAGFACGNCQNGGFVATPHHYRSGQCFVTPCGSSSSACAKPKCKPACRPKCKPACRPVCR